MYYEQTVMVEVFLDDDNERLDAYFKKTWPNEERGQGEINEQRGFFTIDGRLDENEAVMSGLIELSRQLDGFLLLSAFTDCEEEDPPAKYDGDETENWYVLVDGKVVKHWFMDSWAVAHFDLTQENPWKGIPSSYRMAGE
jgi:hypothetical protein